MDLTKIISQLRVELQSVKAAIVSMEELDRIQTVAIAAVRKPTHPAAEAAIEARPPVTRGRGRPRKHPVGTSGETAAAT